jgi:hypothetical protein
MLIYSDYLAVDDAFWDEEFGTSSSRQRRSKTDKSERRRGVGREIILQRYKVMQVKLQDRNGNYFTVKKKVRYEICLKSLDIKRRYIR